MTGAVGGEGGDGDSSDESDSNNLYVVSSAYKHHVGAKRDEVFSFLC